MSASTITQKPFFETANLESIQNNVSDKKDWSFLIPTISVLALGVIFASNVPLGMAIGVGTPVVTIFPVLIAKALGMHTDDTNSEYLKDIMKMPLLATLAAPILEEGFFRGIMQPLLARAILWIAPAAGIAFAGTAFSVATSVSIVATAAIFGLIHAFNDHKNAHIHAVSATLGGVLFGITAAQFGLAASIAAHTVNNTIAVTLLKACLPANRDPGV